MSCASRFLPLLVVSVSLFSAAPARATDASSESGLQGSVGLAVGTQDLGGLMAVRYRHHAWLFSARTAGFTELSVFGEPPNSEKDFALLVGHSSSDKGFSASFSAGVAFVMAERRGDRLVARTSCQSVGTSWERFCTDRYESHVSRDVGLPVEARFAVSKRAVGVGLTAFADVNRRASFGGVAVTFEFGRLR